jgi:hypothetical protein
MSNKTKFSTQETESEGSTPRGETTKNDAGAVTGLLNNAMVSGILQSITGLANTDFLNNLVGQLGQNVGGVLNGMSEHPFLQNDSNRGWLLIGGAVFGVFFLISMLWQFIFSFMLSYASVKVVLWFLEHYEPDEISDETVGEFYVSEKSPVDIIEYLVVLIFVTAMTPLAYFPYMSIIVNGSCVSLSIATLASKEYRRKVCKFAKDLLVSSDYEPGKDMEGKVHKSLQTFCYTIETLNIGTFNMTRNSRSVYTDLKTSTSFTEGLRRLTQKPLKMIKDAHVARKKKDDDYDDDGLDDDLDESFD